MNMMEGLRRGVPAAMVAGLAVSGCSSAQESVPDEIAVVWEDVEQRLASGEGPTPQEIYEEADVSTEKTSVNTAGLNYGERAVAIANAVFSETTGDAFHATSDGVIGGEHMLSLRLGYGWPQDGTATTEQLLESASEPVCTTVLANGIDIGPEDPIAEALAAARGQESDDTKAVVFACIGRLAAEIAPTDTGIVELVVPIGGRQ